MEKEFINMVKDAAGDGSPALIPFLKCRALAAECGLSAGEGEALALENGVCPSRYQRSIGTFGMEGQAKLLRSRAAVIGCGGLGGWIIEILARAGVGEIVLADGDVFSENNLNRQLYSCESNIGFSKAQAAANRITHVNGAVVPMPVNSYLDEENAADILKGCAVAIDALDSLSARRIVFSSCASLGIPFVHGAVGGCYAQCAVFYPGDKSIWRKTDGMERGVEAEVGNPPFTPPFAAALEAAEALKIMAGMQESGLSHTLLYYDLGKCTLQKIKI